MILDLFRLLVPKDRIKSRDIFLLTRSQFGILFIPLTKFQQEFKSISFIINYALSAKPLKKFLKTIRLLLHSYPWS